MIRLRGKEKGFAAIFEGFVRNPRPIGHLCDHPAIRHAREGDARSSQSVSNGRFRGRRQPHVLGVIALLIPNVPGETAEKALNRGYRLILFSLFPDTTEYFLDNIFQRTFGAADTDKKTPQV